MQEQLQELFEERPGDLTKVEVGQEIGCAQYKQPDIDIEYRD